MTWETEKDRELRQAAERARHRAQAPSFWRTYTGPPPAEPDHIYPPPPADWDADQDGDYVWWCVIHGEFARCRMLTSEFPRTDPTFAPYEGPIRDEPYVPPFVWNTARTFYGVPGTTPPHASTFRHTW